MRDSPEAALLLEQLRREFTAITPESPLQELLIVEKTLRKLLYLSLEWASLAGDILPAPRTQRLTEFLEVPVPAVAPVVPVLAVPSAPLPEVLELAVPAASPAGPGGPSSISRGSHSAPHSHCPVPRGSRSCGLGCTCGSGPDGS